MILIALFNREEYYSEYIYEGFTLPKKRKKEGFSQSVENTIGSYVRKYLIIVLCYNVLFAEISVDFSVEKMRENTEVITNQTTSPYKEGNILFALVFFYAF